MNRDPSFNLFVDYLLYLVVLFLEAALNLLPERAAMAFGRFTGRLVFILLSDRRDAAIENLTIAFGSEKSLHWIVRTARKSFEHVGMLAVEFLRIRRWSEEELTKRIEIEGRLSFNLTMAPGMHGICLLNSHFGCFEVSAATTKLVGMRLNLIQTGMKNPFLDRYFFSRGGKDTGVTTYGHKGVVRDMIELLQKGEMVAFLADQRGDPERGVFVDFFGSPAPANEVFARLAIDGDAWVMPLCTFRLGDGRYQSVFGDPIQLELTGDQKTDLTRVSQQFHNVFEEWLRAHPEQGFWLQRKWRRKKRVRRILKKKRKWKR